MSDWTLATSVCTTHGGSLVYRSADGLLGLHITSAGTRPDRRRYFLWQEPDNAPSYASEEGARAALASHGRQP